MTDQDRRRHTRFPWRQDVLLSRGNGGELGARAENVSVGGLAVVVDKPLYHGEIVSVHLDLPSEGGSGSLDMVCRIAYLIQLTHPSNSLRAGLEIVDIAERDRDRLDALVNSLLGKRPTRVASGAMGRP